MRYFQLRRDGESRLAVDDGSAMYDLTSVKPDLDRFESLARTAEVIDGELDDVAAPHLDAADRLSPETVRAECACPLSVDEVWAAGVTYKISEEAREQESGMPEMYLDVYEADRPELFYKASAERTVGPDEAIGVRADSTWNVPEPELGVVLYRGEPVGYTVGNDVSSREIEGANPLYLPQAKIYDRSCALGPCVSTDVDDPHDLEMSMTITRESEQVYQETTTTAEMVRTCEELVSYLTRHNVVPDLTVLLTGTSLVPDDDFSLREGDRVSIDIADIGTLENPVVQV